MCRSSGGIDVITDAPGAGTGRRKSKYNCYGKRGAAGHADSK